MVHGATRQHEDVRVQIPQEREPEREDDMVGIKVDSVRPGVLEELHRLVLDVGEDGALLGVGGVGGGGALGEGERWGLEMGLRKV